MINPENVKYVDLVLDYVTNHPNSQASHYQIKELCNGDEDLAIIAARQINTKPFTIKINASRYENDIVLNDTAGARIFLKQGGFTKELKRQIVKEDEENELKKLQKENLQLQNENLEYSKTIRKQEQDIRDLDKKLKTAELYKLAFAIGGGVAGYLLKMFI
jgi:hypothetical protein